MKISILSLLGALISCQLVALPVRNPAESLILTNSLTDFEVGILSVRTGFDTNVIFNRHLKAKVTDRELDTAHALTNAGYLDFNFYNRWDLFGTLGGTHFDLHGNALPFSPTRSFAMGSVIDITTHTAFSWSVGARGLLWKCDWLACGLEGEYFSVNPRVNSIIVQSNISNYPSRLQMKYQEWQVGLGLASHLGCCSPYGAVQWSNARAKFDHFVANFSGRPTTEFVILNDLKNSKNIGYTVGLSIDIEQSFLLTLEWRFLNERSFFLNGQVRF